MAAILVVLFHASGSIFALPKYFGHKPFGPIFDFGFAGVDFFFVLSGFIMMHLHAKDFGQPRALGSYLWKRFSRIYPPYWVVFAVILPVYFLVPQFGIGHEREPNIFLRGLFLFPHPQSYQVVGVAWTLVYEVFFYLLFGVLILNGQVGMSVFAVWTVCVCAYPWFDSYPWNFLFSYLHLRFLLGMTVAILLHRWQIPVPRLTAGVGVAIFFGTGLFNAYFRPLTALEQTLGYGLGSAVMVMGLVQAERLGLLQPPRWLVYLGDTSYSIYLIHFPALSLLAKVTKATQLDLYVPSSILFCLHVIAAVGVSCVFHHAVEHPIHAWAKRCFRHTNTPAVAADDVFRKAA